MTVPSDPTLDRILTERIDRAKLVRRTLAGGVALDDARARLWSAVHGGDEHGAVAVVLDAARSSADLEAVLGRIGYQLRPLDIVLLHTGADKRLGSADYFAQPGLGREGVLWLVEQGVRVIGIDAYTLDRPFASMVADYRRTGDGRYIWPAHFAGITREYCQIEKLANLARIPRPHGLHVSCLPVKIQGASAGWCRAVALVPPG